MTPADIPQIIAIVILIVASAFFSSAETAYTMASKIKLKAKKNSGSKNADIALSILDNPGRMLSTILVGNNIVNIGVSSLTTTFALNHFGAAASGIATAILTVILLIFGEITPKTLAAKNAEAFAMSYAFIIRIIMIILTPVVFIIDKLAGVFLKLFKVNSDSSAKSITKPELRAILALGQSEAVLNELESDYIDNVFDMGEAIAKDVMTPRSEIFMIEQNTPLPKVLETFKKCKHTKLPVYDGNPDKIVGILHCTDMLSTMTQKGGFPNFQIKNIMTDNFYKAFPTQSCIQILDDMQEIKTSVAIVVDQWGEVVGMLTSEDLVEEIVGNIYDKHDTHEEYIENKDGTFDVSGSFRIDDLNEALNCNIVSDDYDSISGLLIDMGDRLPKEGDVFYLEDNKLSARVISVDKKNNTVTKIQIKDLDEDRSRKRKNI